MKLRRPHVLAVLGALVLAAPSRAEEIRALSGTFQDEPVQSIAKDGQRLVLKTEKRTVPLENVKSVRFDDRQAPEGGQVKVVLLSRDWLRGTIKGGDQNAVEIQTAALGVLSVPYEVILGILFDAPAEKERDIEAKRLATAPPNDTVYLKAGGKAEGTIKKIDAISGITLDCPAPIGQISLALDKAEALATSANGQAQNPPKGANATDLRVRLRLGCGSLLEGQLESLQGGTFTLKHWHLKKGEPIAVKQKDVLELSVVNGSFVYLSDLDPKATEKFPPEFDRPADIWGWKRDKEVLKGGRLRLGGRTYEKGLGVHTYCELEFTLGGAYTEFRSVIGLDDTTRYLGQPGLGGAVFKVLVDGKPAKEVGEAGIKKAKGDPPSELAVDVAGAKTLTLVADYHFMHVLGRADWADAYLVKKR